ncbi:unnamed protein product, partial [Rotaria magnacalcarata]
VIDSFNLLYLFSSQIIVLFLYFQKHLFLLCLLIYS